MSEDKSSKEHHERHADSNSPPPHLTKWQKGLLYVLYGLLVLMVVFSFLSLQNRGEEGYAKCIQKKCELKSQEFCSKPREISNCCEGAGGQLGQMNGEWKCVFS